MKKNIDGFIKMSRFVAVWLYLFFAPTQLAKHFWPDWSYIFGIRSDYLAPTLSLLDAFALFVLLIHINKMISYMRSHAKWAVVGFVLLFHVAVSIQQLHTVYLLTRITVYIFAFKVIVDQFEKYRITIATAFAAGTILQLLLVFMQMWSQGSIQGVWYWLGERIITPSLPDVAKIYIRGVEYIRPYGTFSHPNSLGGFYLMLFFLIGLWKDKADRALCTFLFNSIQICSLFLIILSFSKTAIFSFVFISVVLLVGSWKKVIDRRVLVVQIMLLILLSLPFLSFTSDYFSLSKRIALMENALLIIAQHPLFGVGLGNYVIAQSMLSNINWLASVYQPVHNIVLLFIAEVGVFGVMVGYLLFKKQLRVLLASWHSYWPIFLAIALTGMMDHYWLTLPQNTFLLLFMLIFTVRRIKEDSSAAHP